MLKHPSDPHTPSPLPSSSTPKPLGDLRFSDCQRSLTIRPPCGSCNNPLFVFEGACWGTHGPLTACRVWRKVRRGHDKAEGNSGIIQGHVSIPRATGLGGRDCSVPCVIVLLKDYLFLSPCVTGTTAWGREWGRGGRGSPFYIKGATSLWRGGAGKGFTGAREVKDPHPQASKCSFFVQSLFFILWLFFFFFFPCGWGLVNFLKVLLNLGGESVAAQLGAPFPHLYAPLAASLSTSLSLKPRSSAAPHPLGLSVLCPLSGFQSTTSQSTKQFFPQGVGGSKTLYLFCMCIIIWDVFNYFDCWNKACGNDPKKKADLTHKQIPSSQIKEQYL